MNRSGRSIAESAEVQEHGRRPSALNRTRGGLDLFRLESPGLTAAYWAAIGLFTLAFFVTPFLPLIDYHQHVAIAAILRRLWAGEAEARALYEANYVNYAGGFHLLTAALSTVMSPFHAGRVVMATYPFLFGCAALAIVREAERPRWYAFLALPVMYSRAMAWGFANWNLTWPVAILGIVWFVRYSRGERAMLWRLLACSCFCAYGHVLAMLCLCAGMGVVAIERAVAGGGPWRARLGALIATPLPVAPGILWCIYVYRYQTHSSFSNWSESQFDGTDDPLWYKLRQLVLSSPTPEMGAGNFCSFWDLSDSIIFAIALGVCLLLSVLGTPEPDSADEEVRDDVRAIRALAVFFFACYLVIPKVFVATWFVYERFPPLAMLFLVGALPLRLMPHREELRAVAAGLGVAAGANTARVWATMGDGKDAIAIIDDIPEGRKLLAVTHEPWTERLARSVYVHLPAVYQAKKRGEIAYTFTKFESSTVHYKPGKAPPSVQPGFEWNARAYDVHSAWARAYDVTLVRAPDGMDDPAGSTFGDEAWKVKLMSRRGRFFLYDTSRFLHPLGLMKRDDAIAAIRTSPLRHRADALVESLLPRVRMRAARDPSISGLPVSRLGGEPSLPAGTPWPSWDCVAYHEASIAACQQHIARTKRFAAFEQRWLARCRAAIERSPLPLEMLAQIQLAELGDLAALVGLPSHGLLVFFRDVATAPAGPTGQAGSRVLAYDAAQRVASPPPAGIESTPSCRLTFELEYSLPLLAPDGMDQDTYAALRGRLQDDRDPVHCLSGHPDTIQSSPFADCGDDEDEWCLLAQLDSDQAPGWTWGDGGRLYFCIRKADRDAGALDAGWCIEQSSLSPSTRCPPMIIETFAAGPLGCNCTILGDEVSHRAIVIDPGGDFDEIAARLAKHGLVTESIVHTHTHIDHVGATAELQVSAGAAARIHEGDAFLYSILPVQAAMLGMGAPPRSAELDTFLKDDDVIRAGALELRVIHTPGHTPGSCCFSIAQGDAGVLFAGDTLFRSGIGRTDLWGGDHDAIVASIRGKVYSLGEGTRVVCGHGPDTTIGAEKRGNPFVRG